LKRLAVERKNKGMSKSDLAFELRIQPARISKIENGRSLPYEPTKVKLENYFDMKIDQLLEEVE